MQYIQIKVNPQRRKWVVTSVSVLVGLGLIYAWQTRCPRYGGKSLAVWLNEYEQLDAQQSRFGTLNPDRVAVTNAIRSMGVQASGWLVRELGAKDSSFNTKINEALSQQSLVNFGLETPSHRRQRAMRGIAILGEPAAPAIPVLVEIVATATGGDQYAAIEALAGTGRPALPAMLGLLANARPQARLGGTLVAASLGKIAAPAVPALLKCLNDPNPEVRSYSALALGAVGAEAETVVPLLLTYLDRASPMYAPCLGALENFGPAAEPAIPALLHHLESGGALEKRNSMRVLGRIGRQGQKVVPVIEQHLYSTNEYLQSTAFMALAGFKQEPGLVLSILEPASTNADARTRSTACYALMQLGQPAERIVPLLVARLEDPDRNVQYAALQALDAMGPAALAADKDLRKLQQAHANDASLVHDIQNALRAVRSLSPLPELPKE